MADWPGLPGVSIAEAPPRRLLLVRGVPDGAEATLGVALPLPPCTAVEAGAVTTIWLSPDCHQIETAAEDVAEAAIAGLGAIEVTDARLVLEIHGPLARDLLSVGTSLDLDEGAFPPGSAARTRFGRVSALVHRPGAGPAFRLQIDRALERWFRSWIERAVRGMGS